MRFSKAYIPTSKESPNDAVLISHKLLIRAGFIQSVASGLYNFLPFGKKLLDNIREIVKQELDKSGAQEVDLSFVTPAELWEESGRIEKFGKELLRFRDRKNNLFVLGPTHEEMMVNLIRDNITSYKQLPLNLYQIKTKFRDEARPRFGLMRGREFVMKDGYSFHSSEKDMIREFELMEKTYKNIFQRIGLNFKVVEADSGAIGGNGSREFMAIADSGEDTIVVCNSCNYSANLEKATRKLVNPPRPKPEIEFFTQFLTPDIKKIEDLANFFHVLPYYLIKTVAKKVIYDNGNSEIVLFFLRGSDSLEETKAINSINGLELIDATESELETLSLVAGFIGPVNLDSSIKQIFDIELQNGDNFISGANKKDYHYIGVDMKKVAENNPNIVFKDISTVQNGDKCSVCGNLLSYTKGIEIGHIFQLGTQYSEKLNANFLDENGSSKPIIMGTYGIGVSRILSAIIEQFHDDKGIILPKSIAPYMVNIMISNIKDNQQVEFGENLYQELQDLNISVILDDRKERFGAKIKDAELIGFPYTVIIGKNLKDEKVQILIRLTNEKLTISSNNVLETLKALI